MRGKISIHIKHLVGTILFLSIGLYLLVHVSYLLHLVKDPDKLVEYLAEIVIYHDNWESLKLEDLDYLENNYSINTEHTESTQASWDEASKLYAQELAGEKLD